jgi:hypothetical protein
MYCRSDTYSEIVGGFVNFRVASTTGCSTVQLHIVRPFDSTFNTTFRYFVQVLSLISPIYFSRGHYLSCGRSEVMPSYFLVITVHILQIIFVHKLLIRRLDTSLRYHLQITVFVETERRH